MRVLGVDPAQEIAQQASASGIETIADFFTAALAKTIKARYGEMDLITANNVYAHADDLAGETEGIRHLLSSGGVFIFEVSYLLDMIKGMVFDFAYHEHLSYHSVKPLQLFLKKHGLELIDVKRVGTKGGSIRGVAQLAGGPKPVSLSVSKFISEENDNGLERVATYEAFAAKIDSVKKDFSEKLAGFRRDGKKVAGYGASATSTTLAYHFDLGDILDFIVDDNRQRQNLYSPGFHIPVLSPDAIALRKPAAIVLLAWRYAEPILKKNKMFLDQGGCFIIPLPSVKLISDSRER